MLDGHSAANCMSSTAAQAGHDAAAKCFGTQVETTLQTAKHRPTCISINCFNTSCLPDYKFAPMQYLPIHWSVYCSSDAVRCLNDATQWQPCDRLMCQKRTWPANLRMSLSRTTGRWTRGGALAGCPLDSAASA